MSEQGDELRANLPPDLQGRLRRYARIAAFFRERYSVYLPQAIEEGGSLVTAKFIAAFVHEEAENKRLGAASIRLGPPVVEDRGSQGGQTVPQLHTGKQLVFPITATDIDGNSVDASGASATTDNPSQLVPSIRQDADGPKLVVADSSGPGIGTGNVTVSVGSASVTEAFEVVPGDVNIVNLGAPVEEDRPI